MERTRQPPPSHDDEEVTPARKPKPPGRPSLTELVDVLRGPAVMKEDVDAFLVAIGRPVADYESPRERADLLLALLEDPELRDYMGNDGRTVRVAAVEALLALGYPYALEIPPEALTQARASVQAQRELRAPTGGLMVGGLATLAQAFILVPAALMFLFGGVAGSGSLLVAAALLGVLMLPPALVALGGLWDSAAARWMGVALLVLEGLGWSLRFLDEVVFGVSPEFFDYYAGVPAALLLVAAWMLRHPWREPLEE
jgi:hypothetical protein